MVEVFRRKSEPIDETTYSLLESMMTLSDNYASNELLQSILDPGLGPLMLTESIEKLGLNNTFLSGFFIDSLNLRVITTDANTRSETDLNYEYLDVMNQTTPTDMGSLLADIYQCAQTGGGTFAAVFPGEISQNECRSMIVLLSKDRLGNLIEAGLPDGTQIAHKHGYANDSSDLVIHNMCDGAIIYSPGGNYILSIFVSSPEQIVFDNGNQLFADISRAVYYYFNLE